MSYIPTAPDLKFEIAQTIRARRRSIAAEADKGRSFYGSTDHDEAGSFGTAGGGRVIVQAFVRSSEERKSGPAYGWETRLRVGAVAKCHGHGCVSPDFTDQHDGHFALDDDADVTAKAALPHVQAAREWAQAHAEKCRAQPYTGR
ncbi:hypothetical protein GCM10009837_07210 [Streptomyces durmitorensis]|uniref:Uncharacterized protein n=1 Tax=Streptomyces durmitorensis TaxID=319947 RepID=A0ABY4PL98_9ACTN|nr:hypothetical protein [Streptomyces durmitorensis]UQT54386.1 hypothetical protein M4V62_04385 [Streptomyces durmitorensis]